jgi:cell division protein FtsL
MELTNIEKAAIVNAAIKAVVTGIYTLEISLISENASESPNQNNIDSITQQIADQELKKSALMAEYAKLIEE